jgi:hypothetical protein
MFLWSKEKGDIQDGVESLGSSVEYTVFIFIWLPSDFLEIQYYSMEQVMCIIVNYCTKLFIGSLINVNLCYDIPMLRYAYVTIYRCYDMPMLRYVYNLLEILLNIH